METSVAIIIALLSSPVLIAVVQQLSSKKKLEEMNKLFHSFMVESAEQDLRQKNWKLISTGTTRQYSNQEFYQLYGRLVSLKPEAEWDDILKEETRQAIKVLRGENK